MSSNTTATLGTMIYWANEHQAMLADGGFDRWWYPQRLFLSACSWPHRSSRCGQKEGYQCLKWNRVRYETVSGYVNSVDNVSFEVRKNEIMVLQGSQMRQVHALKTMYDLVDFPWKSAAEGILITESSKRKES